MGSQGVLAVAALVVAAGSLAMAYRLWRRTRSAEGHAAYQRRSVDRLATLATAVATQPHEATRITVRGLGDAGLSDPVVLVFDEPSGAWLRRAPAEHATGPAAPDVAAAADLAWEGSGPAASLAADGVGLVAGRIPRDDGVRAVLVARSERAEADEPLVRGAAALLAAASATIEPDGTDRRPRLDDGKPAAVDSLTGLGTPSSFFALLQHRGQDRSKPLVLLFVAVDGIDDVASELGWRAGEEVLRIGARRLRRCLRPDDELARVDPSVFGVLLAEPVDPDAAATVGRRALRAVGGPVAVTGGTVKVSGRAALVWDGSGGTDAGRLIPEARAALAHADDDIAVSIRLGDADPTARATRRPSGGPVT